jgi:hypothetical protein
MVLMARLARQDRQVRKDRDRQVRRPAGAAQAEQTVATGSGWFTHTPIPRGCSNRPATEPR